MTVLQAILARTRRRSGSSHVSILARAWQVGGLPYKPYQYPCICSHRSWAPWQLPYSCVFFSIDRAPRAHLTYHCLRRQGYV